LGVIDQANAESGTVMYKKNLKNSNPRGAITRSKLKRKIRNRNIVRSFNHSMFNVQDDKIKRSSSRASLPRLRLLSLMAGVGANTTSMAGGNKRASSKSIAHATSARALAHSTQASFNATLSNR
jgi:hypothetical protein